MNFVLGLLVGGGLGWYFGRHAAPHHALHAAHGVGAIAPKPGPPPPPAPGECPYDLMWDPVLQTCVPVLPWPIQQ
jgi:hypothetical protein